jgi:ubiquinone/menaquinone biosynthesis C-methylase UbiE
MKEEGRARVSIAGVALVAGMWLYAVLLLLPIRLSARLRRRHSRTRNDGGLGARFSIDGPGPIVISVPREPAAFDDVAKDYDTCVGPFASPIFSSALDALSSRLPRGARVLDVGCGPGAALLRVARMVPDGEVVGIDVSLGMLRIAADRARAAGSRNVALFQVDAAEIPERFGASFDLAYSCLVHHHLIDPHAAVRAISSALRPGGAYAAIDAAGRVLTTIASPFTRRVDPGWVAFRRREETMSALSGAGLQQVTWVPLAPGIGMAVGTRP